MEVRDPKESFLSSPVSGGLDQHVISEFRENGGKVSGARADANLILLTTTRAGTGTPRTTPVECVPDDEWIILAACDVSGSEDPPWYLDIQAHPRVTVETGDDTYAASALIARAGERDWFFAHAARVQPGLADAQEARQREIPIVRLFRAGTEPDTSRAWAMGEEFVRLHNQYRRALARIREELDDHDPAGAGPTLEPGRDLRTYCLTFCADLEEHHQGEDSRLFPDLANRFPELADIVARLREEHIVVARLLRGIEESLTELSTGDAAGVRQRFEELAEELERHLDYEEEQLVPVLNSLS
ncbi:nitroreductase/quinone reductase family protein [Salinactinospora qingdaonensis]|uniref:Nitroreductase/quinone reductase family protein n=1 Tax=Salinactinospora qingdaonensis TaxID=702744 RepID=A0ABP7G4C1_9ACTN